jgi:hypothetical protein
VYSTVSPDRSGTVEDGVGMTGPRRRRAQLWAGVYAGVFGVERAESDGEDGSSNRDGERE